MVKDGDITHMLHVWYIDLHLGVILFGQMLVNIPYMEHMCNGNGIYI
jgi:hypothetical protein